MQHAEEVLIPITFFLSIAAGFIIWVIQRHRERMSMIEKGLTSDEIKALYTGKTMNFKVNPLSSLKWGLLFILGGFALMLGNYLHMTYNIDEGAQFGLVVLFVGIGLVVFYSFAMKKTNQQ
jgi:hypothetical protein